MKFFSYNAPEPKPYPPPETTLTVEEWEQLSPGFRRAITKEFEKSSKNR